MNILLESLVEKITNYLEEYGLKEEIIETVNWDLIINYKFEDFSEFLKLKFEKESSQEKKQIYLLIIKLINKFIEIIEMIKNGEIESYYYKRLKLENGQNIKSFIGNKSKKEHDLLLLNKIKEIDENINSFSKGCIYCFVKADLKIKIPEQEIIISKKSKNIEEYFEIEKSTLILNDENDKTKYNENTKIYKEKEKFIEEINKIYEETIKFSKDYKESKPITVILYIKTINPSGGTRISKYLKGKLPVSSNSNLLSDLKAA